MNKNNDNSAISYKDSGVNIDEGNRFVKKIKELVSKQKRVENLSGIGSFGGLYDISNLKEKNPVLVTSIDGVGTKLTVAQMMNKHDTVGVDIVSHCVNDILVQGARPLFFTDYLGCGKLEADVLASVIEGIVKTCELADCELMGGETAEMPGMYKAGEYDLAGSITGVVDKDKIITGAEITEGDVLISLPSNGLHTNGYSLARKVVFEKMGFTVDSFIDELNTTIGDALLVPHQLYAPVIYQLFENVKIKGLAHITGGGMTENIPRILPQGIGASIELFNIKVLEIFKCLQKWGNIELIEMLRVFNMGVGMVIIVSKEESLKTLEICQECYKEAALIGKTIKDTKSQIQYL